MARQEITLRGEYIRLDDALKLTGCVQTGGQAKVLIQSGQVMLDGEVCTMRGKKLRGGETVTVSGSDEEIVIACP